MEHDQTIIPKEEIDFFCEEYPDLERWEVIEILESLEVDQVRDAFWRENPTLTEEVVDSVTKANADASAHYYLYKKNNNEAP